MAKQPEEKPWGPLQYVLTGAGVGAAGVGSSIGIIGLSTGLAALPVSVAVGVIGGLVWWTVKTIASD